MTTYDAYIAAPNRVDGLGQEGQLTGKPIPTSPLFPEGRGAYFAIRDAVQSGRLQGGQLDWGSWSAFMTRREIADFLVEIFGPPGAYEAQFEGGPLQHLAERMRALRAFIDGLPTDEVFAVVGEEF